MRSGGVGVFVVLPVDLAEAGTLRTLTGDTVGANRVAVGAYRAVGCEVAKLRIAPPRFLGNHAAHDVLIDAPLTRCPLQQFVGGAGEIAVNPSKWSCTTEVVVRAANGILCDVHPLVLGDPLDSCRAIRTAR